MESAIGASLVLAQHAYCLETNLVIAADRLLVGGRRVDADPVMAALVEQPPGEQADRLHASALALVTAAQEDVDPGVPLHRVLLFVILDAPGDLAVHLHH
jgi:hypothetical protein